MNKTRISISMIQSEPEESFADLPRGYQTASTNASPSPARWPQDLLFDEVTSALVPEVIGEVTRVIR